MEKTNSKSISSLIFGIVSIFLPFIGLIPGVMGIVMSYKSVKEINNSKEKGIGLAVSGRIVSIIGICYQLVIILGYILFFQVKSTSVTSFFISSQF